MRSPLPGARSGPQVKQVGNGWPWYSGYRAVAFCAPALAADAQAAAGGAASPPPRRPAAPRSSRRRSHRWRSRAAHRTAPRSAARPPSSRPPPPFRSGRLGPARQADTGSWIRSVKSRQRRCGEGKGCPHITGTGVGLDDRDSYRRRPPSSLQVARATRSSVLVPAAGPLAWTVVVGRTGSNRRPCGFQPGATHPSPSNTVRLSRIRPDQQTCRRTCHSG
jgi:hypothetical protein